MTLSKMELRKQDYARPLCFLLAGTVIAYLLYHSLCGGTLLCHSSYDSYSLIAENWLAGRNYIENGEYYTWLELAIYQGRYYQSFPPVPAVFALPWVVLCGSAAAVPSNLIVALYGLLAQTGIYCLFARRGYAPATCLWWALLCTAGSNFAWMSTSGGVWFAAQTLNLVLVVWGLFFAQGHSCASCTAAFLLALAVGCRPFSILVLAAYLFWLLVRSARAQQGGRLPGANFWLPVLAAAAVGAALAAYNYVRFGSILEFGHTYLPEFQQAQNGQFSLVYLWKNLKNILRPVTLTADLDLNFSIFNGFLIFEANPVFLVWAVRLVRRAAHKTFARQDAVALAGFVLGLLALCVHKTFGGWQFGARYTVDLIPYVLWGEACATDARRTPKDWEWFVCAVAVVFNAYGAVYMLSH